MNLEPIVEEVNYYKTKDVQVKPDGIKVDLKDDLNDSLNSDLEEVPKK